MTLFGVFRSMKCPIEKNTKRKNKKKLNSIEEASNIGSLRSHDSSASLSQCKEGRHFTEGIKENSEVSLPLNGTIESFFVNFLTKELTQKFL